MQEEKFLNKNQSLDGVNVEELKKRIEHLEFQLKKEVEPSNIEKERLIKDEIKDYLGGLQQTPNFASSTSTRDEADEISQFEPSGQIGALISLAFERGLPRAISVAKSLNNPAVLDEFHDALIDHYYNKLIEEKIIRP